MEADQFLRVLGKISLFLLLIVTCTCTGCVSLARIDGPYQGKVIDADSRKPLEGVVVHGAWYTVMGTVGGASSEWHDSAETLTDKSGEFYIAGKGLLLFSNIDEMGITLFKAGYEQWTPNIWSGLKGKWSNDEVTWDGNHPTFTLKRLSMEERRRRGITSPTSVPNHKRRLLLIERNKEMIEIGRPVSTLIPVE